MSETESSALNGENNTKNGQGEGIVVEIKKEPTTTTNNDVDSKIQGDNGGGDVSKIQEPDLNGDGTEETAVKMETSTTTTSKAEDETNSLPIVIDDLAALDIQWFVTKNDENTGNWGKEYETSEMMENVDDGQFDIEPPPSQPEVIVSNNGQTMHLVPLKDNGRTSTTLTWIRKSAVRKDSASDRRITIRGLGLGDLFHPRIYTLIQMSHVTDYSSTDRTISSTCSSGILTMNFRTILDKMVALRRYLLDIEIPDRRLEIVCTFPDHKRPPDFDTLWKIYSLEGVPPCSSQRPDREILAKQIVIKNIPTDCDEPQIRKYFGSVCDEVEFLDDYENHRCAIVTFLDIVNCHIAHSRQSEIVFEDGTRPQIFLMTEMVANSKLMPRRAKAETEDERQMRHTFEILWNHQQKMFNAGHGGDRYGNRGAGNDFASRRALQNMTRKLPVDMRQRVEDRAQERKVKEVAEKEAEKAKQETAAKAEEAKNGADAASSKSSIADATPLKRPADSSPADAQQALNKKPRRKAFRGASAAPAGIQRRGMMGGNRRDPMPYRGERGPPMLMSHRGGPPSPRPLAPSPASRYGGGGGGGGGGYSSPWIVPPGASNFDRHMEAGSYGSPPLMARREMLPPEPMFGTPGGGMPYGTPGMGYMGRDVEMRRSGGGAGGGGELYQRRDAMGPEYQRDYRGFYGKR